MEEVFGAAAREGEGTDLVFVGAGFFVATVPGELPQPYRYARSPKLGAGAPEEGAAVVEGRGSKGAKETEEDLSPVYE